MSRPITDWSSDAAKVALAAGLAVVGFLLGYLVLGEWAPDYKRWPIPEELASDGSGRLADVIPGEWDVICYVVPYSHMREQVRDGLRSGGLPTRQAGDVPEFYLGENEYAIVVLGVDQKPRILLIDKGPRKRFYFGLEGERCHTRAQAQYDVGMSQSKYGTRATVTIVSRD